MDNPTNLQQIAPIDNQNSAQVNTGAANNTYDINNFEVPASSVKLNSKSFTINGERYMAGTFCLVRADQPNQPPHIVLIFKPKLTNLPNHFQGMGLLRPEAIADKITNYTFKPNELVVTKKQSTWSHTKVIDKCFVYTFDHALKGEPVGAEGKMKFLVNLEFVENKGLFKKIEDTKKFSPKDNPRAFKPAMKLPGQNFKTGGVASKHNNFQSPANFGFEFGKSQLNGVQNMAQNPQSFIPQLPKNLPETLQLKSKAQIREILPTLTNDDTKSHYQKICKTLGLIPETIRNEFPQNGQNEVVWYPTPPLNTSFKSHRKLGGGVRHSLKYLKFREAKKAANKVNSS